MVRKIFIAAVVMTMCCGMAGAQENQVNRLPGVSHVSSNKSYDENNTGLWVAAEMQGAYSCRLFNSNFGFGEGDVTVGYRFNEFLRVGVGVGARCYFDNDKVRYDDMKWAFPLYGNVRGNFIPAENRNVTPYYSVDCGGTIRDGFMIRPTIGLRIGRDRSAFLVGLGYTGQDLKSFEVKEEAGKVSKRKFVSFVHLRIGYEF